MKLSKNLSVSLDSKPTRKRDDPVRRLSLMNNNSMFLGLDKKSDHQNNLSRAKKSIRVFS